jgi:iron complex outermembrane receptor protein
VSLGGDSLGGTILADSEKPAFAEDEPFRITARGSAHYAGSQDAYGFAGTTGIASQRAGLAYTGSYRTGDDLRIPGGTVSDTGFETSQHGLLLSGRHDGLGVFSVDGGLGRTEYAGTPALMMDITKDASHHVGGRWTGDLGFAQLEARGYWHHIDHEMDNFTLRPNAGSMANPRSRSPAESRDAGYRLDATLPLREQHRLRLGSDMNLAYFDSTLENLTASQEQTGIPGAHRNRVGVYAEWEARWTDRWQTLVGVREDTVWSNAGDVTRVYTPMDMAMRMALAADAAAFNALDRSLTDVDWEATALVRFEPMAGQRYELGLARKVRAPSMLERYTWTPLMASAGLADGRFYWGNVELDPETAYQVALTGSWSGERWRLEVSPFYTHVVDYIQGSAVPGRIDPMTGNAILRWENFDHVNLVGVDAEAGYTFNQYVGLRGYLSYVRGRNHSAGDDLYRTMPLHGAIDLDLRYGPFSGTAEVAMAARQDEVSGYNGERPTAGWAVLNLSGGYTLREGTRLVIGVENLLGERYELHTNGVNQVQMSDVAIGRRIPEAGRFFYAGLALAY